ncbi:hypothetical protein BJV82DRAFT_621468 [Fennellomyces sp. T-0311]|nr:hypothetical protein BJV82DRAFT_621468 [Fennellomyces sp. T-0311]
MSAFSFINATSKKQPQQNLAASLADDFFVDQFASFVNQSPPKSRAHQAGLSSVHTTTASSSSSVTPPFKKSAFSFISASTPVVNNNLLEIEDETPPPAPPPKSTTKKRDEGRKKQSSEISQLSAETTWKRIQAEKDREKDKLQRFYHKRVLTHEQLIQLHNDIEVSKAKAKEALDAEDFLQAQALQTQQTKLTEKMWDVFSNTESQIEHQIHVSWESLAVLLARETEAARKLADACKNTKDARERQFLKYHIDNERKYEEKLQQINQQRGKIDQEKSEIAFDMEMWEQADTEFKNRMDELVHKERKRKNELTRKMKNVQDEIDDLMSRLGELQQERDECEAQVHELDIAIHEITRQYLPEKDALENDFLAVQQRQQAVEKRSMQLDKEDEMLYHEMERHSEQEAREKKDMEALEEQIKIATKQLEQGQKEHDSVLENFRKYVQARDELISEKKQAMIRAHFDVDARVKALESVRRQVYTAQCQLEAQEGSTHHLKSQLSSLTRQKKLAVETSQLQLAAEAASQIKSVEASLADSESTRVDRQQAVDESLGRLYDEEQQIEALKKECSDIQQKSVTEMLEIFQKSKESMNRLKQLTLLAPLQLLVELELESLDARVKSTRCQSDDKVDNLLSIDDDPPTQLIPS